MKSQEEKPAAASPNAASASVVDRAKCFLVCCGTILDSLLPQALKQIRTGNPIRKARTVVRHRNPFCAAFASIDDDHPTPKPSKISGSQKARRPAADDETIERAVMFGCVAVNHLAILTSWNDIVSGALPRR